MTDRSQPKRPAVAAFQDDVAAAATPGAILAKIRASRPLVHAMTGPVSAQPVANALLAIGAAPIMALAPSEAADAARRSDALLINLGSLSEEGLRAMTIAIAAAQGGACEQPAPPRADVSERAVPWALDPVGVGAAARRTAAAIDMLDARPALVRGNASEIRALAGAPTNMRGVDADDPVDAALAAGLTLAERTGGAVLISGETDAVIDGAVKRASLGSRSPVSRLRGGDAMMTRVTAMGCRMTAAGAAALGIGASPAAAARFAAILFACAGEAAAAQAHGPGSFDVGFFDALYRLTPAALDQRAAAQDDLAEAHA